ncbi:MAG: hypothetical protein AB9856_10880 [Cellulosilyticaceae bacterium]
MKNRWELTKHHGIIWDVEKDENLPHTDHVEMSGKFVSLWVKYGIDEEGNLLLSQKVVWPTFRTIPNNTHASLVKAYKEALTPTILINEEVLSQEKPYAIYFDGILTIKSRYQQTAEITRTLFPTREHKCTIERICIKNIGNKALIIKVPETNYTDIERGTYGIYMLEVIGEEKDAVVVEVGETIVFGITFNGRKLRENLPCVDLEEEELKRRTYIEGIQNSLKLETPEPMFNQAFEFAKLRAAESVFETKCGLLHSPGGLAFYAAIWTNDEAEYAGPFFPFLGDSTSIEATLNCYRLYQNYMGPDYRRIPSSIISEGMDIWEGAGDRGDAAMYAYGASRFALAMGRGDIAKELWDPITWCLEYCRRKLTKDGVVASESDELEGRFETGSANLATSALTYGALRSAACLGKSIGKLEEANNYDLRASKLYEAIEEYFGVTIEGYRTYRYYEGNDLLRSWICLPLAMGIMERKQETIKAIFSPNIWTMDGLLTQTGTDIFWDRATLYAFNGVFAAGEAEQGHHFFKQYTEKRLLGNHVPYAIENEYDNQGWQLSGESALYCRVFIEGIFGIIPTGLSAFTCMPNLPRTWDRIALRQIKAFENSFDLDVERHEDNYTIMVTKDDGTTSTYVTKIGEKIIINM